MFQNTVPPPLLAFGSPAMCSTFGSGHVPAKRVGAFWYLT